MTEPLSIRFVRVVVLAIVGMLVVACSAVLDVDFDAPRLAVGGVQNGGACAAKTCPELGASCGIEDDGCGGALDCGTCATAGEACAQKKCQCQPQNCAARAADCGTVPDGCGNTYDCGSCTGNPAGPNCGGGGPNKCGTTVCTPLTCAGHCGDLSDGCGTILKCPGCPSGQTCGAGGAVNVCGCSPKTCAQQGKNCGTIADGCGQDISCGACASPKTCGGGGASNVCGCKPSSCAGRCGQQPDGCGGTLACGYCGGGGGCFVAGTQITMADGALRPIADVVAGDWVRTLDPDTGAVGMGQVAEHKVHTAEASNAGIVVVDGVLRATRNHPIKANGKLVTMDQLQEGDTVMMSADGADGAVLHRVSAVRVVPGHVTTHDLVLTNANASYFASGLLVPQKN